MGESNLIEVKIPKEIKSYKEKIFFNLSIRQTLSFVAGLFVVVPFFIYAVTVLKWNSDLVGWLAIFIGIPLFSIGFFSYRGMSLEKLIYQIIKTYFIYPTKRVYRSKNNVEEFFDGVNTRNGKTKNKKK